MFTDLFHVCCDNQHCPDISQAEDVFLLVIFLQFGKCVSMADFWTADSLDDFVFHGL